MPQGANPRQISGRTARICNHIALDDGASRLGSKLPLMFVSHILSVSHVLHRKGSNGYDSAPELCIYIGPIFNKRP